MGKKLTKAEQLELLKELAKAKAKRDKADAKYELLRGKVDAFTGKRTTTVSSGGESARAVYEDTTTTKKDTKGLYAEFGITKADEERYTTRTPSTRFSRVELG